MTIFYKIYHFKITEKLLKQSSFGFYKVLTEIKKINSNILIKKCKGD